MIDKNYEKQVIDMIDKSASATIPIIIKDLIHENTTERARLEKSWLEYKGEVPIKFKPKLTNRYAPDNRPVNAFRNLIVSEKVGYMTGVPIKYKYTEDEIADEALQRFLKINDYEWLDSTTIIHLAATGKAFRLLYLSKNNVTQRTEVKMTTQLPWECIVVTDSTLDNLPTYGMIYYQVELKNAPVKKWRWKVEWYDNKNIYYFIEDEGGNFVPDDSYFNKVEEHGFNEVPLVQFNNNLLKQSDFCLVADLIDSYDNAVAFALNDNETVSNALMIFKDVPLTQTLIDQARYLRGISIESSPNKPNPEVSYLTKDIKIDDTDVLCKLLEENIFKFASAVDIYNESFTGGSVSGESRKQQLIPLELKCKETERLYQQSMRQVFSVASSYWSKVNNIMIAPEEIDFIWTRAIIPTEYTLEQTIQLYNAGLISQETAISKIPYIDDPQDEISKIESEDEEEPEEIETEETNNNIQE